MLNLREWEPGSSFMFDCNFVFGVSFSFLATGTCSDSFKATEVARLFDQLGWYFILLLVWAGLRG